MKMYPLKKSDADQKADDAELRSGVGHNEEGEIEVHLDHHHLKNMKIDGPLPHGHPVTFHGEGEVVESGTRDSDGTPRHHMRIRLHKGNLEHEPVPEHGGLRDEIKQNKTASEAKAKQREEDRVAKHGT